jgi:hypothetical protein
MFNIRSSCRPRFPWSILANPASVAATLAVTLMLTPSAQSRAPTAVPGLSSEFGLPLAGGCDEAGAICTWEEVIGGRLDDEAHSVVEMPGGGYTLAGHTRSHGVRNRDAWILRLDPNGKVVWQQTIGGPLTEKVFGIEATSDGGVVIVGKTYSAGAGGSDALIVRISAHGQLMWQHAYGEWHNDGARDIVETGDGGFIVAGSKGGEADDDVWVFALDESGDMLWERTHGTPGEDGAVSVAVADDGGFAVAGYTQRPGMSNFDNWVIRLGANGDMLWQRHFSRGIFSAGTAISAAPDGGFFVAGISQERTPRDSKSSIVRLARDGSTLWQQLSGEAGSNEAWGAAATEDGGVLVVSAAQFGGLGESEARLVRFGADGEVVWSRLLGGGSWDRPTAVITTRDGGILVAGYTTGRGAGYQDVWVIRLDAQGRLHRR